MAKKATLKHNASGKHILTKNNNLVTIIMNDRNKNRTLNFSNAEKKIRSTPTLKEEAHPQQYIFKNTEKILLFSVFCCKEYIHQDQSLCTNNH